MCCGVLQACVFLFIPLSLPFQTESGIKIDCVQYPMQYMLYIREINTRKHNRYLHEKCKFKGFKCYIYLMMWKYPPHFRSDHFPEVLQSATITYTHTRRVWWKPFWWENFGWIHSGVPERLYITHLESFASIRVGIQIKIVVNGDMK